MAKAAPKKTDKPKAPEPTAREILLARNAARDQLQSLADQLLARLSQDDLVGPTISQIIALAEVADG